MCKRWEDVFHLFTSAVRRNQPLKLDLMGAEGAFDAIIQADMVILDPDGCRILARLENGDSINNVMRRDPDDTPQADHAIIVGRRRQLSGGLD